MLSRIEACDFKKGDWKRFQWFLQCKFPAQFGEQAALQIFAQQNNYQISEERAKELDARAQRLTMELNGNGDL